MAYVHQTVGTGENFLIHSRISKVFWIANLLSAILSLTVLYGVAFFLFRHFLQEQVEVYPYGDEIRYAVIGLAVFYLILRVARSLIAYATTEIAVSNQRFVVKFGWISRAVTEISIPKIEGVFIHQGIIGRVFGYGSVTVRGTGGDFAVAPNVHDPLALQAALHQAISLRHA